jgi:acylglycerol lipase
VLQGTNDTLVTGGEMLYEQAASTEKSIKHYQGALHDLLHERVKEEVMSDICQWLEDRMMNLH